MSADELHELRAARDDFLRLHQDYPQARIGWSIQKDGRLFWALSRDDSTAEKDLSELVPGFMRIKATLGRIGQILTVKVALDGVGDTVPDPCARWIYFLVSYCGYLGGSIGTNDAICPGEGRSGTFYPAMEVCAAAIDLLVADLKGQLAADSMDHPPVDRTKLPKSTGEKKRAPTVNERMIATLQKKHEAMGWNSTHWAKYLKCGKSTVVETATWKCLESTRIRTQAKMMKDRRRKPKGSDSRRD